MPVGRASKIQEYLQRETLHQIKRSCLRETSTQSPQTCEEEQFHAGFIPMARLGVWSTISFAVTHCDLSHSQCQPPLLVSWNNNSLSNNDLQFSRPFQWLAVHSAWYVYYHQLHCHFHVTDSWSSVPYISQSPHSRYAPCQVGRSTLCSDWESIEPSAAADPFVGIWRFGLIHQWSRGWGRNDQNCNYLHSFLREWYAGSSVWISVSRHAIVCQRADGNPITWNNPAWSRGSGASAQRAYKILWAHMASSWSETRDPLHHHFHSSIAHWPTTFSSW